MIDQLVAAYHAEKEQALFYRALSSIAEEIGDETDIEALNGLLADEQHHLSRLRNRMTELGLDAPQARAGRAERAVDYENWRAEARVREAEEIARYEAMLALELDAETDTLVRSILQAERLHEAHLGGKYMDA